MTQSRSMLALQYHGVPGQVQSSRVELRPPRAHEILIEVRACGVCRTDLHIVDGELVKAKLPIILGHEIVGIVKCRGEDARRFIVGYRVGVPWLAATCGHCRYCTHGRENLCADARFTGYQIDGGFAEFALADERYCFELPARYADAEAAPLLCAGLIGYRALKAAGDARRLGLYGFGAAAHIVAQLAHYEGRAVYAFTRPGNAAAQAFALKYGACWVGDSDASAPEELDAAILFAPVGALVPLALRQLARGGTVVCAGIHMSEIPSFPYELLWGERTVRSVANLTRLDAEEFLELAPRIPVRTEVQTFSLNQAADALDALRRGRIAGAAVIVPDDAKS